VEGVREGRIIYANIRKLICNFISTGMGTIVMFLLAVACGLPAPLTTVQLLWLNLVTGGLQDLPLALERGEGDELRRKPRPVNEPIFDRLMLQRVALNALVTGIAGFCLFYTLLAAGATVEEARNLVLLLLVCFETAQVLVSRSETRSVFCQSLRSNPLLWVGMVVSQLVHVVAMHVPWMQEILHITPVSGRVWAGVTLAAMLLLLVNELYKWHYRRCRAGGSKEEATTTCP